MPTAGAEPGVDGGYAPAMTEEPPPRLVLIKLSRQRGLSPMREHAADVMRRCPADR
jgi:hypothetical protein